MKKLFTLFVGINDYQGRFNSLRGCVRDVNRLEDLVMDQYANSFELHHLKLVDKDATYKNIVEGFQNHLRKAGPDDTVWFHYSGHGTEEPCADEFLTLEPNGKDQNLICFDTWPDYAPYLADKELAVLINQVATTTTTGQPKSSPHIVISLDCCHSGSGTRDASEDVILPRAAEPLGIKRDIKTYLNGYYADQNDRLNVPSSKHVLLAACESVQLAGDTSGGGVFTEGLVEALRRSKGEINYADLFMLTRSTVGAKRKNQTPQFQTIENFNPYTKFLEGTEFGTPDRYEVVKEKDWFVKCGAIHGLPTDSTSRLEVEIQDAANKFKTVGKGFIESVGAQRSKIDLDFDSGLKGIFDALTPGTEKYVAVFNHFPAPPIFVKLAGDPALVAQFESKWSTAKNIRIATSSDPAQLEVQASKEKLTIIDHDIPQEAYSLKTNLPDSVEDILNALEIIAKWKRMTKLRNQNTRSKLQSLSALELEVVDSEDEVKSYHGGLAMIYASEDNSYDTTAQGGGDRIQILRPYVNITNAKQDLYFYLFQLQNNYSIVCHEDQIVFRPSEHPGQTSVRIPLWSNNMRGWGLMPDQQTQTCQFKLLVTTEELDYQQLVQAGLSSTRTGDGTIVIQKARISNDWWMIDMDVTMNRQDGQINSREPVVLSEGGITIEPHESFTGKVGIGDTSSGSRSASGAAPFELSSRPGFEKMNFNKTRNATPQDLLEINGIHPTAAAGLGENPLKITLDTSLEEHETMLPIAFDGEHYYVVGDSESKDGKTVASIRTIPEPGEAESRSVFQSLKLAFFKIGLKKKTGMNMLRRAEVDDHGKVHFSTAEMGSKIAAAKKTLLVIHGLLGDTSTILKNVHALKPEVLSSFDLILAFDYENLAQSLDETATALNESIVGTGIANHPSNELTILAHGTGGLVARKYIETMGGNSIAKHLIMVGTPNNGTQYGQIDKVRSVASTTLDIALNFAPQIVPFAGTLLTGLKKVAGMVTNAIGQNINEGLASKIEEKVEGQLNEQLGEKVAQGFDDITRSLRDMTPESKFINDLNSSADPGVQYTIVSGDVEKYATTISGFSGFLEKSKVAVVNLVLGKEHDLFASIGSIENRDTWLNRNPMPTILSKVDCHHYNYFQVDSPLWDIMIDPAQAAAKKSQRSAVQDDSADSSEPVAAGPPIFSSTEEPEVEVKPEATEKPEAVKPPVVAETPEVAEAPVVNESLAPAALTPIGMDADVRTHESEDLGQKIDDLIIMVKELNDRISKLEGKLSNGKITFD